MGYTDKIARRVEGLDAGEHLLAACKAMIADQVAATILFSAGAVAGGAGAAMASTRVPVGDGSAEQAAEAAGLAAAPQMILGLTDRRLLAWRMSGILARPREMLGTIERSRILGARLEESKMFGLKVGRLLIELADTPEPLDLSVPRVHLSHAAGLVAALS